MEKELIQLLTREERNECFMLLRKREVSREALSSVSTARLEYLLDLMAKQDYLNWWDTQRYSEKEAKERLKTQYVIDVLQFH